MYRYSHPTDFGLNNTLSHLAVRHKTKTRVPSANHMETDTPDVGAETTISTANAAIPRLVVKKAFNTFAALFGKTVAETLTGKLPWNYRIGAEKLQGSAWLFKPAEKSAFSSITFHEPHPDSKLPMQWARRIARRLNRNFG